MTQDNWKHTAIRYVEELISDIKRADHEALPRLMSPISRPGIGTRGARRPGFRDEDQVYHLSNDPREMNNLAYDPAYSEKLESLKELLNGYIHQIGRPFGGLLHAGNAAMPGQLDEEISMPKSIRISGRDVFFAGGLVFI